MNLIAVRGSELLLEQVCYENLSCLSLLSLSLCVTSEYGKKWAAAKHSPCKSDLRDIGGFHKYHSHAVIIRTVVDGDNLMLN